MNASDLGQAVTEPRVVPKPTDPHYVLISYLPSPLMPESRNDYVVFALNGATADEYHWFIKDADARDPEADDDETIDSDDTDDGIFQWTTPDDEEGEYVVAVQIKGSGLPTDPVLRLYQSVRPINPGEGLEAVFPQELNAAGLSSPFGFIRDLLKRAVYAGEWDSTSELLFELWGYVFDAANATDLYGIPTRLLAAVIYQHLLTHPKDFELTRPIRVGPALRSTEIAWAARELNDVEFISFSTEADNALGVAQIRPETAAMVLGCTGTPWTEKPRDSAARRVVDKQIHERYLALPESVRIGLFNMLRFPRSNIAVAAKLLAKLKNRLHRWPDLQQENLIPDNRAIPPRPFDSLQAWRAAAEIIATEYLIGAIEETPGKTPEPNEFGRAVARTAVEPFIAPFFIAHTTVDVASRFLADPAMALTYDGLVTFSRGEVHAAVASARTDLELLGIRIGSESPPTDLRDFDFTLECAVREFQVYAKVGYVALSNAAIPSGPSRTAHLRSYPNLYRYGGPISGVLNLETRRRLQAWKASNWRCPVLVQAWQTVAHDALPVTTRFNPIIIDAAPGRHRHNIWRHDVYQVTTRRNMFFRDFSRYYKYPTTHPEAGLHRLGGFDDYTVTRAATATRPACTRRFVGGVSVPNAHCWPEAEILPERLIDEDEALDDLGRSSRVTFRVIRAASEVECLGFFDSVNTYDTAFVSLGPCHWTLGVVIVDDTCAKTGISPGELCGFLSYLRFRDLKAFRRAVRFFGLRVDEDWIADVGTDRVPNGQNLLHRSRKYVGWIARQNENSAWVRVGTTAADEQEGDYFKNWHWFYRWVMAGRTIPGFQRAMWDMARLRLRDLLSTPWGTAAPDGIPDMPDMTWGGVRAVTMGDVFTSERAVALLLRWHIFQPANLIANVAGGGQRVDSTLRSRYRDAVTATPALAWAVSPDQWDHDHEEALVAAIMRYANAAPAGNMVRQMLRQTLNEVNDWPYQAVRAGRNYALATEPNPPGEDQWGASRVGRLRLARNSFAANFDKSDLPPRPDYANPTYR